MHGAHVMHRHRSRFAETRHRARKIEVAALGIDRAAKPPISPMMVIDRPFVAARHDKHRPVLAIDIVEHDANGREIVIGVRIEGPTLVPFDRRAISGRFHVELAGIEPHRVPQLLQDRDDLAVAAGAEIRRINEMRRLQPADARLVARMRVFEIVDLIIRGDRGGVAHEFVGDAAQFVDLGRREHIRHDDKPVPLIGVALCSGQHLIGPPHFLVGRPARRASTACTPPTSSSA